MPIGLTPEELVRDRSYVLVDMRPVAERTSELGFIPGSLLLPLGDDLRAFAMQMAHLSNDGPIVLSCVSGRRSGNAVRALEPLLGPTRHLEGGLLAWSAQGFPISHPELCEAPVAPASFHASFRSRYVAELVEAAVELDLELDPIVHWRFAYESTGLPLPRGARDEAPSARHWPLLDRAAATLRLVGVDHARIEAFLTPLYASTLHAVDAACA